MFELFQCYDTEEFFLCDDKNTRLNFAAARAAMRKEQSIDADNVSTRSENDPHIVQDVEGEFLF